MSSSIHIHQYTPSAAEGDGVTTSVFFIQNLLLELGYQSTVFGSHFPPALGSKVEAVDQLNRDETDLLLVHHSMGHDLDDLIEGFDCPKVIVYHNITPEKYFAKQSMEYRYSIKGRQQLQSWRDGFIGAIGDSPYNSEELQALDYPNVISLPMLLELDKFFDAQAQRPEFRNLALLRPLIISVGRIVENKRQHLQIKAFNVLKQLMGDELMPQLVIVGGTTSPDYDRSLKQLVADLNLEADVLLPGKCSDGELRWLYQNADCYWCTSEHEGFCIPLVEAGAFELPVIAFASSNIPSTLGEAGLILDQACPESLAAVTSLVLNDVELQLQLKAAGKRNVQRYKTETLKPQLYQYLTEICPSLALNKKNESL